MSLILDALNRAERERKKTQDIPDLQTVHEPLPATAAPSSGRNTVFVILGVMVVGLLVVMVYLFARPSEVAPPVMQSTAEPGAQPVNSPARVSPASTVNVAPAESGSPHRKPSVTERAAAPAPGADAASQPDLDALYASARAEDKPKDPVTSLYAETPEIKSPAVTRNETVAALPPVAVRNYDSLINIPDIGDLPWGFRQEIPSINYIRHNFDVGGSSSVVINSKAHYAGSNLAPDLVLEEIYVDGAIFQFKQIKFKLRALNSWVNM